MFEEDIETFYAQETEILKDYFRSSSSSSVSEHEETKPMEVQCSPSCSFKSDGDFYFCSEHKSAHYCGKGCLNITVVKEESVCLITGRVFPSIPVISFGHAIDRKIHTSYKKRAQGDHTLRQAKGPSITTLMRYASDVSTSPHSERIRRSSKGYFRSEIVSPTPMQTE